MTGAAAAPHVSVVMPVYNGGDYIALALDSVLAQTYRDFEIVLVNDGSRDEGHTDRLCRRYADAHPGRIRYILQENGGVGSALNTAIGAMRGEVFCWLSHDDLFEPFKLERQVDFFVRLGKAEAMLFSDYRLIDPEGRETAQVRLDPGEALRAPRLPLFRGWINGCTLFIPKALFPSAAPFDPQYRYVQDYRLWLELLERAELFHQPELLVRYRTHPGQDSRRPDFVAEADALWIHMVDRLGPVARAQISGSDRRYYEEVRAHLEVSHYPAAAAHAAAMRDACGPDDTPAVLPGADLHARIQRLKAEVDEALRFISDPRFHAGIAASVDLGAGELHREHAVEGAQPGAASLGTGARPWAYVASLPLQREPETTLMKVEAASDGEEAYVLLVDESYGQVAERQRIAGAGPLWFDLQGLPERMRLIVQAGEAPCGGVVELRKVALLSPDPRLA